MTKRHDAGFEERLCRVNGQRPTARDKWRAFYRLWRIAHGHGGHQDIEAGTCFRVLFPDWRFISLIDGPEWDGLVDRSHVPTFLRKQLLDGIRKRRLYAGHYEWMERDKVVAKQCRDVHGIEVTPLQVAEVRRKVIQMARAKAAEMGVRLPADDEDVLRMLKKEE